MNELEKEKVEYTKSSWDAFVIIQAREDCDLNNRGSMNH